MPKFWLLDHVILLLVQFHVWSVPGWRYIRICKIIGHIYIFYIHLTHIELNIIDSCSFHSDGSPRHFCHASHGLVISYLLSILLSPSFQQTCFCKSGESTQQSSGFPQKQAHMNFSGSKSSSRLKIGGGMPCCICNICRASSKKPLCCTVNTDKMDELSSVRTF